MAKPTDVKIKQISTATERIDYRAPMKFGGRVVRDVTLLNITAEVETRNGRRGIGHGSMTMGNVWAWPTDNVPGSTAVTAMVRLGEQLAEAARNHPEAGHPLALTRQLARHQERAAAEVEAALGIGEPLPRLAQLVAASPLEAAIYDAYGVALGRNVYDLLGSEHVEDDLAAFLTDDFGGEYLDRYTLRHPKTQLPLYHLVGALDPLATADVTTPVGDGLPETLFDWILADELTHLKIKLAGNDLEWDLDRVGAVERITQQAQARRGCAQWWYSLDFNEKCPNVDYVLAFLNRLRESSGPAFARIQYIEQPTHRDLRAHPENRMHAAAAIKPVVIDESLVDLESLLLACQQGYSGVALKACKGHSEALLMGAVAQKMGLFLCVQDLTCVGRSFLHSASLAARIPTVAAIEGNGRQYCPAGNRGWTERFPGMFEVSGGTVRTAELNGLGLGF